MALMYDKKQADAQGNTKVSIAQAYNVYLKYKKYAPYAGAIVLVSFAFNIYLSLKLWS